MTSAPISKRPDVPVPNSLSDPAADDPLADAVAEDTLNTDVLNEQIQKTTVATDELKKEVEKIGGGRHRGHHGGGGVNPMELIQQTNATTSIPPVTKK